MRDGVAETKHKCGERGQVGRQVVRLEGLTAPGASDTNPYELLKGSRPILPLFSPSMKSLERSVARLQMAAMGRSRFIELRGGFIAASGGTNYLFRFRVLTVGLHRAQPHDGSHGQ